MSFITCPFCSGHEAISPQVAEVIGEMIGTVLATHPDWPRESICELENIRNVILNTQGREAEPEQYVPPICPTPDKAKYGDYDHSLPNARKYKQHPYHCECGYWHLSKQHSSKINSPPASADEFEAIDPLML